jgi:hypothetical protein
MYQNDYLYPLLSPRSFVAALFCHRALMSPRSYVVALLCRTLFCRAPFLQRAFVAILVLTFYLSVSNNCFIFLIINKIMTISLTVYDLFTKYNVKIHNYKAQNTRKLDCLIFEVYATFLHSSVPVKLNNPVIDMGT